MSRLIWSCVNKTIQRAIKYHLLADMGLENSKKANPPAVFLRCQPNFMRTLATMVEYRLLLFLAQFYKMLWHFEIFTWALMGKPKMWNISRMADRRMKPTKIWDSMSYSAHIQATFDARFLDFGLGSFGPLCKISDFTIFETLLLQQFTSDFNQASHKAS